MATKLSSIFASATVSEMQESTWIPVEGSQVKFSKADLKLITKCSAVHCEGKNGEYVAIKVQVASQRKEYWFTADIVSAKRLAHMEEIDASKLVLYALSDGEREIQRMRVL